MLLSALLLIQEPAPIPDFPQVDLPAVGSEAALESQDAFRAWSEGLRDTPHIPFLMDVEFVGSVDFQEDPESMRIQATFSGSGQTVYRSLREFQHQWDIKVRPWDADAILVPLGFQSDGEFLRLHIGRLPEMDLVDGMNFKLDLAVAEKAYAMYRELTGRMGEISDLDPSLPDVTELAQEMARLMPADLPTYLHPSTLFHGSLIAFTCRRYTVEDGIVNAHFSFDLQEGSYLGNIFEMVEDMILNQGLSDDDFSEGMDFLQSMADGLSFQARFDEATGLPLGMDFRFRLDMADLDMDEEGAIDLVLHLTATLRETSDASNLELTSLGTDAPAMDVTGFLQMAMGQMQDVVDMMESDEDLDF